MFLIIEEACDNHFGSIEKAKKMIELAKKAGANIIKFQHHLPDEEMLPDVPKSKNFKVSLYEFLKKNALKLNDHKILKEYCKKIGITYLCTPFSYKAAKDLMTLNVCGFKIGSGELSDHPTIKKICDFKKKVLDFDHEIPTSDILKYCEYISISLDQFNEICHKHRDKDLWKFLGNNWKLTNN